jgi:hypothetical protein
MSAHAVGAVRRSLALGVLFAGAVSAGSAPAQNAADAEFHPAEAAVLKRLAAAGLELQLTEDKRLLQINALDQKLPSDIFAELSACKFLRHIGLGRDSSHFAALEELPEIPTLESLSVHCPLRGAVAMRWTERLPNLQMLNLEAPRKEHLPERAFWRPGDSNAAVARLRFLDNLVLLRINGQQVTAEGLAPLAALEKLRHLELNDTPVDDNALVHVAKLDQLETLHLAGTAVTDQGLWRLAALDRLDLLSLNGTAITDEGLDTLREFDNLRRLRVLYLADTKITDKGMKALADLKSLAVLDLANTQVSDEGLAQLAGLKELYNLHLQGVHAEEETVRWLQDQLPKQNVIASYSPPAVPLVLRRYLGQKPKTLETQVSPIFKVAHEWKEQRDAKNASRLLELAGRLREEINKHLPFRPYTAPLEAKSLAGLSAATPGRHTLLGSVQYASTTPPGPGESYINTCLVFLDGHLLATGLQRQENSAPKLYDGYISQSLVIVDGAVGISSYIGDSIVIADGPIVVHDGYINNSLVISLHSLRTPGKHEEPLPPRPTIYVRGGYINNSVILGTVECDDLRNSVILGAVSARQPYLRGAEILQAGKAADLPWEVGGE